MVDISSQTAKIRQSNCGTYVRFRIATVNWIHAKLSRIKLGITDGNEYQSEASIHLTMYSVLCYIDLLLLSKLGFHTLRFLFNVHLLTIVHKAKHMLEGDTSIMTYRGHSVLQTLIRCHFSPSSITGQRYIYTGCAAGRVISKFFLIPHEILSSSLRVIRDEILCTIFCNFSIRCFNGPNSQYSGWTQRMCTWR